jgi:fused signal recognition particle receptor
LSKRNTNKPPGKKGLFARLKERLAKTKHSVIDRVKTLVALRGKIDEELLSEIEEILIQADIGVSTTAKIISTIREETTVRGVKDPQTLITVFKQALLSIVSKSERPLVPPTAKPSVIFVVGVNGVGKTTTIGKLAKRYHDAGKSVMLVAADTFRAAAVEQLEIWAERSHSDFVKQSMGADPASVCYDALNSAKARATDVVIIDTAGRLHTKINLMEELKKMVRVIRKLVPDAPHESLLILDATTGQNAINQTKIFSQAIPVTGIVMTKLDGTAKGGILVAIRDLFEIPVVMIGVGEKLEDLRDFDPQEYVDALFES